MNKTEYKNSEDQVFRINEEEFHLIHRYVLIGKLKTHFVEIGKGKTIYILPGYPGSWSVCIDTICKLSRRYHVIALNLPGFPGSPAGLLGESKLVDFVTFLNDFQKTINIPIDYLFGISYGGAISLHYAVAYPENLKKLILHAPAYNPKEIASQIEPIIKICKFSVKYPFFGKNFLPFAKNVFLTFGVNKIIKDNGLENVRKSVKKLIMKDIRHLNIYALAKVTTEMTNQQDIEIFKKIEKPTLVICGDADPIVHVETSENLAKNILANAEFISIKDGNHWLPVLMPDIFSEKLIEFIES